MTPAALRGLGVVFLDSGLLQGAPRMWSALVCPSGDSAMRAIIKMNNEKLVERLHESNSGKYENQTQNGAATKLFELWI